MDCDGGRRDVVFDEGCEEGKEAIVKDGSWLLWMGDDRDSEIKTFRSAPGSVKYCELDRFSDSRVRKAQPSRLGLAKSPSSPQLARTGLSSTWLDTSSCHSQQEVNEISTTT